ncbi:unnamed protein product [Ranitomeya imitator]|uniref:Ig-like domain-containing protein n=1 Tax=Ranitomeya imitator TaxID=111125 RepID=A0ABN9LKR0_9NEOB|nr:unnamed protein product [Ranitomeya imitator]
MTRAAPLLVLICWTQWCLAADVIQRPQFHNVRPADDITLNCEHDDSTYYAKYWYRQKMGKELVLIGYSINDAITMEPEFNDKKAKIQPNGNKISVLTIYSASIQDSARYYDVCINLSLNSVAFSSMEKRRRRRRRRRRRETKLMKAKILARTCLAEDVIQKPRFHLAHHKENVALTCVHDKSGYDTKYWYKQQKGLGLVLIGFTVYSEVTMESDFKDGRIIIQPNSTNVSHLNISNVSAKDSAVYYCASSIHSQRVV